MTIQQVGMIGRGAVGTLFGHLMQETIGKENFHFIVGEDRYPTYTKTPFYLNDKKCDFLYVCPSEKVIPLDLLFIVVKGPLLKESLEIVKPYIKEDTVILTLLNGIVSEQIVEDTLGKGVVIHSIAQMMDAVKEGNHVHYTKTGEIVLGCIDEKKHKAMLTVQSFLDGVGIPNHIAKDIINEQWSKLMLNCGINQICAVYDVPYGACQKPGELRDMLIQTMEEVKMIATLEKVKLAENEIETWLARLDQLSADSMPSMRQDRLAKRISEVDFFSKTIMDLAKKHNVAVPINTYLYEKIKEIESQY